MTARLAVVGVLLIVAGLAAWALLRATPVVAPAVVAEPAAPSGVPALPADVAAAALVVAWTAHGGARLEPCGCVAGMHGGLVRRASLLARVPRARRLTVECGGWSGGSADYQRLRTGYYLDGLVTAGCDAIGLGGAELALGRTALAGLLAGGLATPLVCANLRVDPPLPIATHVVVEKAGRRFAVTAVVAASAIGDGLSADDPAEALVRLLPSLSGLEIVVLADLDEGGLAALAKAVPGIALVIGGAVARPSMTATAIGACRVVHVANEGKTLGWWPWAASACAFELIEDTVPDLPEVRALIHAYQERLGSMDLAIDERSGLTELATDRRGARYVGSASCVACHPGATTVHAGSGHAHALATLERKRYHNDPDCLRCHVTGLSQSDGFSRKGARPELGQVSCESCHGRGSLHVAERQAGRAASGTLDPVTPATCVRCHDRENSPRFAYPDYWQRIVHGAR